MFADDTQSEPIRMCIILNRPMPRRWKGKLYMAYYILSGGSHLTEKGEADSVLDGTVSLQQKQSLPLSKNGGIYKCDL